MMVIGRFCVLFRHGPHREAITPSAVVQRTDVAREEVQEATTVIGARNGRPIVTAAIHDFERTIVVEATARSTEIDRGGVAVVGPEVPTKVGIEVGGIFGTLHIEFGRIGGVLSCGSKPRKGVVGRQLKTNGTGVVNGFDHRKVVTGVGGLHSGIVGRPQVVIKVTCIPGRTIDVEAAGILNAIGDGHVVALVLLK